MLFTCYRLAGEKAAIRPISLNKVSLKTLCFTYLTNAKNILPRKIGLTQSSQPKYFRYSLKRIFLLIGFTSLAHSAAAAIELPTILVSSQRAESQFQEHIGPVQVITDESIKASGAKRLSEVLEGQLGIQLRDLFSDGSETIVGMRGFSSNASANTLVVIDGRRLNEGDISAPRLNTLAIADIARIEILPSSAGSLWGDQAVGGVIHIITKTPTKQRSRLSLSSGSYRSKELQASHTQIFDNDIRARVSANFLSSDNFRDRNQYEKGDVSVEAIHPYEKGELSAEYNFHHSWSELPGAINNATVEENRRAAQFADDDSRTLNQALRISHKHWSDKWDLYTADFTYRHTNIEGTLGNVDFKQKRRAASINPRWVQSIDISKREATLTSGLDLEFFAYDIESLFGESDATQQMAAIYTHANIPVTDRLNLNLGSRYAYQWAEVFDKDVFPNDRHLDNSAWVGELAVKFTPNESWSLYAKWDRNFRFPKVDEQLFTNTPAGQEPILLKTQTGVSVELGAAFQRDTYLLSVHLYQLRLDNEIDFDPSARNRFGFLGANNHLDPTRRQGFIGKAEWSPNDWLSLHGIYQLTDARFREGPFSGKRVPFVAKHSLRFTAEADITEDLQVNVTSQTLSNRVALNDNANAFRQLGGFTLLSANLAYDLKPFRLTLSGKNLTNKRYHNLVAAQIGELFFYPAPERTFWLTLEWESEER